MPQSVIAAKERSASTGLLERHTRSRAFFCEVGGHHRSVPQSTAPLPPRLDASAFPADTPLNAFFAWNEAAWRRDRRYLLAHDPDRLPDTAAGKRVAACLAAAVGNTEIAAHAAVFAAFVIAGTSA